eukprot:7581885-Pyramimonas_sp.AAC.1
MSDGKRLDREEVCTPVANKQAKTSCPLDGLRVFIVSGGGISEKRGKLLAGIATRLGALASTQFAELSLGIGSLIVVASPDITPEKLRTRLVGIDADPELTIVGDAWISTCSQEKRLVSLQGHLLHQKAGGGGE